MIEHFTTDDGGYERWLADNQGKYVINAERSLNPNSMVLHRASCRTINGAPARGTTWVGHYVKLVGAREELEAAYPAARTCGSCL